MEFAFNRFKALIGNPLLETMIQLVTETMSQLNTPLVKKKITGGV